MSINARSPMQRSDCQTVARLWNSIQWRNVARGAENAATARFRCQKLSTCAISSGLNRGVFAHPHHSVYTSSSPAFDIVCPNAAWNRNLRRSSMMLRSSGLIDLRPFYVDFVDEVNAVFCLLTTCELHTLSRPWKSPISHRG